MIGPVAEQSVKLQEELSSDATGETTSTTEALPDSPKKEGTNNVPPNNNQSKGLRRWKSLWNLPSRLKSQKATEKKQQPLDESSPISTSPKIVSKKTELKQVEKILHSLYKISTITLIFFLISYLVTMSVSAANVASNSGFYTSGSPVTIFWISIIMLLYIALLIIDSYFVPITGCMMGFRIRTRKLFSDRYTSYIYLSWDISILGLILKLLVTILTMVSLSIIWLSYTVKESRDRLTGWFAFSGLIPMICYILVIVYQFAKGKYVKDYYDEKFGKRKHKQVEKLYDIYIFLNSKRSTVMRYFMKAAHISVLIFTFLLSLLLIGCVVQAVSVLSGIQSMPGQMVEVPLYAGYSQTVNLHMYCEGDEESEDAVLIDADVGVASPYAYMKNLVSLLGKNGMRACVMERGGYGFSDSGPFPRDLTNTSMTEMVSLVKEASFKTPFVLISHSKASFTARTMMEYHRKLLRGVILLHPSHEKEEETLLRTFLDNNETTQEHYGGEVNYVNILRMFVPLGIFRIAPSLLAENQKDNWYDRYYMNGVKKYFYPAFSKDQLKIYDGVIHSNKFTNTVWSELKSIPINNKEIIHNREHLISNSTRLLPLLILTSQYLLEGNCTQNFFPEGSTICQDFLQKQSQRASIIQLLHQDLFDYYNQSTKFYSVSWKFLPSDYDIALHHPELILPHLSNILQKQY